jgi:hypothetical protein
MNTKINIQEAVKLVNKKNATLDAICKFIFTDIEIFQNSRETFYMEEFKNEMENDPDQIDLNLTDHFTDIILKKIQRDVQQFSLKYASDSIDEVLDAINEKLFKKNKIGPQNLLVLLSSLKEMNEN